eukprot:m.214175 g.214175  ORF g.214175 m.214175 type:complete len:68 (-) comp17186_c1_seq2:891-1094(-)
MAAHDASESTTTAEATYEELLADQSQWFTVEPRKDCPHVTQVAPVLDFERKGAACHHVMTCLWPTIL